MNFQEYLNQEKPQYKPNVEVKRSECTNISKGLKDSELITLTILGEEYTYIKLKSSRILYTMDLDGNKKNSSVFKLID
jgi:hypothetical protein